MGPLKTFYCQETEKWRRSHPGRVVTIYQIGELFGNVYKRAATGEIAVNGFQATGLFSCDKNIFRPYDFPLSSEDQDAASVNHPALVKTSYQPSFSSANFSPFTSAEATQKKKIKQASKSKTSRLASNALLLGPSKRRKRRVCRDPTPSDTPDSDTDLAVPFADDSAKEDQEQDADCLFCTGRFSEDHTGED
jgi:hypothetical protein